MMAPAVHHCARRGPGCLVCHVDRHPAQSLYHAAIEFRPP